MAKCDSIGLVVVHRHKNLPLANGWGYHGYHFHSGPARSHLDFCPMLDAQRGGVGWVYFDIRLAGIEFVENGAF